MGHYRSEMGSDLPPSEAEAAAQTKAQALRDRGYSDPIEEGGWTGHTIQPRYVSLARGLALRWHEPCGQAVFDPEAHDRYCPARPTLSPAQEDLHKRSQFWSDASASYGDN